MTGPDSQLPPAAAAPFTTSALQGLTPQPYPERGPRMTTLPFSFPALVVLIGASGSGKTHIATAFPDTWRLSLDDCRLRVADDAGAQDSTPAAVAVFDQILAARLARALPTVVDATNTEAAVRASLVDRARLHRMPTVAIVLRTGFETCLDRQQRRAGNRQVPAGAIAYQHTAVPDRTRLLAEGFDQVHDAVELDLLRLLLTRAAASGLDVLADVRATFGKDLADVFVFDPDSPDSTGAFTVGGREVAARWMEGEPFDGHWQARLDSAACPECEGPLWVKVTDAADLLSVYVGTAPDEAVCDRCDR